MNVFATNVLMISFKNKDRSVLKICHLLAQTQRRARDSVADSHFFPIGEKKKNIRTFFKLIFDIERMQKQFFKNE